MQRGDKGAPYRRNVCVKARPGSSWCIQGRKSERQDPDGASQMVATEGPEQQDQRHSLESWQQLRG